MANWRNIETCAEWAQMCDKNAELKWAEEHGYTQKTSASYLELMNELGIKKYAAIRMDDKLPDSVTYLDHLRLYRNPKTRNRAAVFHEYPENVAHYLEDFREWCHDHGLQVEELKYSWYYPDVTRTFVVTEKHPAFDKDDSIAWENTTVRPLVPENENYEAECEWSKITGFTRDAKVNDRPHDLPHLLLGIAPRKKYAPEILCELDNLRIYRNAKTKQRLAIFHKPKNDNTTFKIMKCFCSRNGLKIIKLERSWFRHDHNAYMILVK